MEACPPPDKDQLSKDGRYTKDPVAVKLQASLSGRVTVGCWDFNYGKDGIRVRCEEVVRKSVINVVCEMWSPFVSWHVHQ